MRQDEVEEEGEADVVLSFRLEGVHPDVLRQPHDLPALRTCKQGHTHRQAGAVDVTERRAHTHTDKHT